jgi:hypothetical protein
MPSWKMVSALIGMEPGTMPPLSDMWPNIADQARCRPSLKIGTSTIQSGKCETAALHRYGSLVRMTSPSSSSPS